MILTLYPRGKDSVSLRWLQLAAHNHLPHSIIRPCGARMQRQQWKENPMEDLCWTVATSAQSRKQSVENASKVFKSNLQKVSQLKSIAIPWQFPWNWMVRQAKKMSGLSWKKRSKRFFQALLCSRSWPQRMVGQCCKPCQIFCRFGVSVKLGFAGKRMKWLGKRGALKWKLCKWLKTFKQLNYIIIWDSRMEWMIRQVAIRIKDRFRWPLVDSNLRKATFSMVTWGMCLWTSRYELAMSSQTCASNSDNQTIHALVKQRPCRSWFSTCMFTGLLPFVSTAETPAGLGPKCQHQNSDIFSTHAQRCNWDRKQV